MLRRTALLFQAPFNSFLQCSHVALLTKGTASAAPVRTASPLPGHWQRVGPAAALRTSVCDGWLTWPTVQRPHSCRIPDKINCQSCMEPATLVQDVADTTCHNPGRRRALTRPPPPRRAPCPEASLGTLPYQPGLRPSAASPPPCHQP